MILFANLDLKETAILLHKDCNQFQKQESRGKNSNKRKVKIDCMIYLKKYHLPEMLLSRSRDKTTQLLIIQKYEQNNTLKVLLNMTFEQVIQSKKQMSAYLNHLILESTQDKQRDLKSNLETSLQNRLKVVEATNSELL